MGRNLEKPTLALLIFASAVSAQSLPVGELAHDGPATPEQLSLVMPVNGTLSNNATASVRYKLSSSPMWIASHDLFRIRPEYSNTPAVGTVSDDFAWTILDLDPGRSYDVEVTVTSGGTTVTRSASFSTRRLPPAAGAPNRVIAAGTSVSEIQGILNGLRPGDVLQFEDGQYNTNGLNLDISGTSDAPIYIRGESRNGVVINDSSREIIQLIDADDVVIENLTLQGTGHDTSVTGGGLQRGITSWGIPTSRGPSRLTIRNTNIVGVDSAISIYDEASQMLVYDNTIIGNNEWTAAFLGDNRTWDDDGINLPGFGNVAFNNTISGFGDTFSYAQHSGSSSTTEGRGIHFYRNDIRNSLDDVVEVDHGIRNITFYDNRIHNTSTCSSLDPLYGGPFIYVRNICINPARSKLHKWNNDNTGQFFYNNTFIVGITTATSDPDVSAWYQPNNGDQEVYGFRNNIVVYRGSGNTLWLESGGHSIVDWTHNSWYPNREIQFDFAIFRNLADAQGSLRSTTPIFSGSTRRMESDNITVSNPWTNTVALGQNAYDEITQSYVPTLANGTTPKNSGIVLPNITDGYSGPAPDRGAIIGGRPLVDWGDRGSSSLPDPKTPNPPENLIAN